MTGSIEMDVTNDRPAVRVRVGRIPFEVSDIVGATNVLINAASESRALPVRLANAYCVAMASSDDDYAALLNGPGLNYPDGVPVSWYMRTIETQSRVVRGPTLFCEVLDKGRTSGISHFMLGTTDHTLKRLVDRIDQRFQGVCISGTYAPPFGPVDDSFLQECVRRIGAAKPDIVWVALGSPKQDFVAADLARLTGLPCVAVGAAFDFVSGTVAEAPGWLRGTGFEWVFRLASEPRRLWRRYLIGNSQFLKAIWQNRRETKTL